MRCEMKRIDPASAARLAAILVFAVTGIVSLFVFLAFWLVPLATGGMRGQPVAGWMLPVVPLAYGLGAYLFAFVGCAIYNLVAARFGGIVVELSNQSI